MMRWEYETPVERLCVSNGKTVFFYLPEEKQVQKTKVKESRDQRIPFLFLLGKGNFKRDFSKVEWASDEKPFFQGNRVLLAYPKKGIDEFARILMEFSPQTFQLQRVTVFDVDGTTSEFVFTNIQQDLGTAAGIFEFKAPPGTEVIVGVTLDPQFGPVVMFGLGGIFVEVYQDVSFRLVPLAERDAAAMIHEIKAFPILQGVRGRKPADLPALTDLLLKVSQIVQENPEIAEMDLNPVLVYEKGLNVVDARVLLHHRVPST